MSNHFKTFRTMTQAQILAHFDPEKEYPQDEVLVARLVLEEKRAIERENAPLNGSRAFRLMR